MRLFEIHHEIERILAEEVDRDTGEILDSTLAKLDALEIERDAKALQVARYLKGEQAEAEAVKTQAEKLAARARVHAGRAARLKGYLLDHCEPGRKLSDEVSQITWRKSTSVELVDFDELPEEYQRVSVSADKTRIGEALKSGKEVPGARLVTRQNVQVR